jgi:hypothetical protein
LTFYILIPILYRSVGLLWYIACRKAEFWIICLFIFKLTNIYHMNVLAKTLWQHMKT